MKYDFGGYATKNDLRCADGRIIRRDAFKECDGLTVPLVYAHVHDNPMNVLGHAELENRPDGVYCYCSFNDTEPGRHAKELVKHGDVKSLSIYANRLKQNGSDVIHGVIREVSMVLAGANPGAMIENVTFAHGDGLDFESEDDVIIRSQIDIDNLSHADDDSSDSSQNGSESSKSDESEDDETVAEIYDSMNDEQQQLVDWMMTVAMEGGPESIEIPEEVEHADNEGPTAQEVWDSMTEKQQMAANYLVGKAMEESDEDVEIDVEEVDDVIEQSDEGSDNFMYQNVFNQNETEEYVSLSHDDMEKIVNQAKSGNGSLKEAICSFIKHNFDIEDEDPAAVLQHGIEQMDILFPEARSVTPTPELVSRPMDWVSKVWNATKKSPFARVKSVAADITADEARARGYQKGKKKIEEVVKLLKRKTEPQTVYKLQKLDRDDVIDATELDTVAWLKKEMRMMLEEEMARAIMVGDGRSESDESHISETNIRPIYLDDDFYTIHELVEIPSDGDRLAQSDAIVDAAILSRKNYMGSGSPVLYASIDAINTMLLARDKMGHRLYRTMTELADALRVSEIVEVPVFDNVSRVDEDDTKRYLLGIIVNLRDYTVGADRGGEVNLFDDFDINYNKYEYLIETRCSGALTKPYSAIALESTTSLFSGTVTPDDGGDDGDDGDGDDTGGDEVQG